MGSHLGLFMANLIQRSWKLVDVNGFGSASLRKKVVTISVVSDFFFASSNKLNSDLNMN